MYQRIVDMPRGLKKALIFLIDLFAVAAAAALALILRLGDGSLAVLEPAGPFVLAMLLLAAPLALVMRIPSIKLLAFDLGAAVRIGQFALLLGIAGAILNIVLSLGMPRTVPLILAPVLVLLSVGWKLGAVWLVGLLQGQAHPRIPVAIYGAGAAGTQLIFALNRSREYRVVAVVDDNPTLFHVMIGGLRVQPAKALERLALSGRIEQVLLAMPSVGTVRRREILGHLGELPCKVQTLPAYPDIIRGGGLATSLKPVSSDDLLGRDAVTLDIPEIAGAYRGRSVMVSGAGGSIGSELCRQLLDCDPRRIVLFERSEFALYSIDRELRPLAQKAGIEVVTVLGSVTDEARVRRTLEAEDVEIVLHAAAYKHVPLVEANELEGVLNNVIGTQVLGDAAVAAGVERFILVSTDKAVRPTNIMGATKRMAEMMVQNLARRETSTRLAMVRFGNVLGSSGSVIPLFQSQIAEGGPVTLTHPEVTRFFMTMPEAARLVLLAGSFAEGGDLFVLDMGEPVKIHDLARRMIELSGLTVREASNPDGDIEIALTGLRPGEKLYEELLIDAEGLLPTPHPKILRASEDCPSELQIAALLAELRTALSDQNDEAARRVIAHWVEGYHPSPAIPYVAAE